MKSFFLTVALFISIGTFAQHSAKNSISDKPTAGFKLTKIESGSIYQQLGLKSGDIIRKVNGDTPKSLDAFGTFLSKTKAGDKIDLLIERQGKEETLHYTIK